jgi:hypothetical protein
MAFFSSKNRAGKQKTMILILKPHDHTLNFNKDNSGGKADHVSI